MDNRKRNIRRSRIVAVVGIVVASAPPVLDGSVAWSLVVVLASIVVYYAGASTVLASSVPVDER